MLTIRLARHGGKKKPFYHVTVAERSAKRDGRFIERVGFYNPVARGQEEELRIDLARVDYWLSTGAQPTDRVTALVARWRKVQAEQAVAQASAADEATADSRPAAEAEPAEVSEPSAEDSAPSAEDSAPSADAEASNEPA